MNRLSKLLMFLSIFTLVFSSCKKQEIFYSNNAEIIGYDMRMCPSCGGLEITIDGISNPNGNQFFLAGELPSNFSLGDNPKFPVPVTMDWKTDSAHCLGNYIEIIRIKRR